MFFLLLYDSGFLRDTYARCDWLIYLMIHIDFKIGVLPEIN